mmetsp:Transcript_32290/g.63952  ORF Transcript_32290/g.63952 Transcript_32290/m.63952 type:complete len:303 (+) Transcript_32290:89-997(+)
MLSHYTFASFRPHLTPGLPNMFLSRASASTRGRPVRILVLLFFLLLLLGLLRRLLLRLGLRGRLLLRLVCFLFGFLLLFENLRHVRGGDGRRGGGRRRRSRGGRGAVGGSGLFLFLFFLFGSCSRPVAVPLGGLCLRLCGVVRRRFLLRGGDPELVEDVVERLELLLLQLLHLLLGEFHGGCRFFLLFPVGVVRHHDHRMVTRFGFGLRFGLALAGVVVVVALLLVLRLGPSAVIVDGVDNGYSADDAELRIVIGRIVRPIHDGKVSGCGKIRSTLPILNKYFKLRKASLPLSLPLRSWLQL